MPQPGVVPEQAGGSRGDRDLAEALQPRASALELGIQDTERIQAAAVAEGFFNPRSGSSHVTSGPKNPGRSNARTTATKLQTRNWISLPAASLLAEGSLGYSSAAVLKISTSLFDVAKTQRLISMGSSSRSTMTISHS